MALSHGFISWLYLMALSHALSQAHYQSSYSNLVYKFSGFLQLLLL